MAACWGSLGTACIWRRMRVVFLDPRGLFVLQIPRVRALAAQQCVQYMHKNIWAAFLCTSPCRGSCGCVCSGVCQGVPGCSPCSELYRQVFLPFARRVHVRHDFESPGESSVAFTSKCSGTGEGQRYMMKSCPDHVSPPPRKLTVARAPAKFASQTPELCSQIYWPCANSQGTLHVS